MSITVFIRDQLDPFERAAFEECAVLARHHRALRRRCARLVDAG
jgi:hypothetical protein